MPGRKEYRGGSGTLSLNGSITAGATSCFADGNTAGWPTGVTYPFIIRIDGGNSNEEKILCSALVAGTPSTITFTTRGYDGTAPSAHGPGAPISHVLDADSLDTFADHAFNLARDDHTQYIRADGTRAFTGLSAIAGNVVPVGAGGSPGLANTLARSDHIHDIAEGAIDHVGLLVPDLIDASVIAPNAITASELADGAVDTPAILDNAVTNAKIPTDAIDSRVIAPAAVKISEIDAATVKVIQVCTSGTRPASPAKGDMIFETNTNNILVWQGPTDGWTPSWNMSWGTNFRFVRTTDITGIGVGFTNTGIYIPNRTMHNNRFTQVSVHIPLLDKNLAGQVRIFVRAFTPSNQTSPTTVKKTACFYRDMVDNERASCDGQVVFDQDAAGIWGFDVQVWVSAGTVNLRASDVTVGDPGNIQLLVSDVGPNGLPS